MNFCHITIAGYIASDPVILDNPDRANLSVAFNPFKRQGQQESPPPLFFSVTLWGAQSKLATSLVKGQEILVTGEFSLGGTRKDGTPFLNINAKALSYGRKPTV